MGVRSKVTGEWCAPTRELGGSQLIQLVNESRQREAVVETIHDVPTRKFPAAALEILEYEGGDSNLAEARPPDDSRAPPIAEAAPPPDPDPTELLSELEVEQVTAMLAEMSMIEIPTPPVTAPVQSVAPQARQVRKRSLGGLVFVCVDVLVFLCLGSLSLLGTGI